MFRFYYTTFTIIVFFLALGTLSTSSGGHASTLRWEIITITLTKRIKITEFLLVEHASQTSVWSLTIYTSTLFLHDIKSSLFGGHFFVSCISWGLQISPVELFSSLFLFQSLVFHIFDGRLLIWGHPSNLFFQCINASNCRLLELVVIFHLFSRNIVIIRGLIIFNKVKFRFFRLKFSILKFALALFFILGLFKDLGLDLLFDHFFCDFFR